MEVLPILFALVPGVVAGFLLHRWYARENSSAKWDRLVAVLGAENANELLATAERKSDAAIQLGATAASFGVGRNTRRHRLPWWHPGG